MVEKEDVDEYMFNNLMDRLYIIYTPYIKWLMIVLFIC